MGRRQHQSFKELFAPIEEMYRRVQGNSSLMTFLMADLNQVVLIGEVGILLGYLARRVLGQYDLCLLGREPVTTGASILSSPISAASSRSAAWTPTISASG